MNFEMLRQVVLADKTPEQVDAIAENLAQREFLIAMMKDVITVINKYEKNESGITELGVMIDDLRIALKIPKGITAYEALQTF